MCAIAAMSASIALLIANITKKTTSTPVVFAASTIQPAAVMLLITNSVGNSFDSRTAAYSLTVCIVAGILPVSTGFFQKFLGLLGSKPLTARYNCVPRTYEDLVHSDRCDLRSVPDSLRTLKRSNQVYTDFCLACSGAFCT